MMEGFYGLHNYCSSMAGEDNNMVVHPAAVAAPADHYHGFQASSFPVFGSEQLFSGSSVSDAASTVAEMQTSGGGGRGIGGGSEEEVSSAIRAKISSHPLYPKLIEAYIDCQKVGAPPQMAYLLDEIWQENGHSRGTAVVNSCLGADPELDEFMETYCDLLLKYKSDLSRPFDEAVNFLSDIETQFNSLCNVASTVNLSDEAVGSSDEDGSGGEVEMQDSAQANEDRELKDKLLRKYSGYISTLKSEFSKKKKKGKLPREARQVLLNWWNIHYKWPYPTEADKVALADVTGLDQKQINNWFINQRKRHWKPTENMQFAVVDSLYGPFFMKD